jgi:Tfp pilus assembly protein FimT
LIELIIVVVVLAVIASLAAPSFTRVLAKKRVEGIASELVTDLQYARSEAVQRNEIVRVTFGTGCYVIHTEGVNGAATCSQTAASTTAGVQLKTVQLPQGSTASLVPNGITYLQFEPERGSAKTPGSVNVNSTSGEWQLQAVVAPIGRVRVCSPNSSFSGYSSDCT